MPETKPQTVEELRAAVVTEAMRRYALGDESADVFAALDALIAAVRTEGQQSAYAPGETSQTGGGRGPTMTFEQGGEG